MRLFLSLVAAASLSCSSSNGPAGATANDGGTGMDGLAIGPMDGGGGAETAASEDFNATASDFDCFKNSEWTLVGLSHYKNALGHAAEMLSVATSADGGTF